MSRTLDDLSDAGRAEKDWYLRKSDGVEYGPEKLETIARWAAESRVVSGNAISFDRKEWIPVEDVPTLGMEWIAVLPDGRRYGPFNLGAARDLVSHRVLPGEAVLTHRTTGVTAMLKDYLEHGDSAFKAPEPTDASEGSSEPEEPREGGAEEAPTDERRDDPQPEAAGRKTRRRRKSATGDQAELWNKRKPDATVPRDNETATEETADGSPADDAPETATATDERPDDAHETDAASVQPAETAESDSGATAGIETTDAPADDTPITEEAAEEAFDAADAAQETGDREVVAALQTSITDLEVALATAQQELAAAREEAETARRAASEASKAAEDKLAQLRRERDALEQEASDAKNELKQHLEAQPLSEQPVDGSVNETEQRLEMALAELKKARQDEERARSALSNAEQQLSRKVSVLEKRLQDAVQERSALAALLDNHGLRTLRLRALVTTLLVLNIILLIALVASRGCHRDKRPRPAVKAKPAAAAQPAAAALLPPLPPPVLEGTEGVTVLYSRNGCRIIFEEGVFASGTVVSDEARALLEQLAVQIKRYMSDYDLRVVGHTDSQPLAANSRFRTNRDLALARAEAAAQLLINEFGLPPDHVITGAGSPESAPHPNMDSVDRARNRTVELELVRHASR